MSQMPVMVGTCLRPEPVARDSVQVLSEGGRDPRAVVVIVVPCVGRQLASVAGTGNRKPATLI